MSAYNLPNRKWRPVDAKVDSCPKYVNNHIGFYSMIKIPPQLYECMRGFGRLAIPLFAFSLAFGFIHSKNWLKYF